jgi:hypothetical protein
MILTGNPEELGENPVPVLLCPLQIPDRLMKIYNSEKHRYRRNSTLNCRGRPTYCFMYLTTSAIQNQASEKMDS